MHHNNLPSTSTGSTPHTAALTRSYCHHIQAPRDYMQTRYKSGIYVPKRHFNLSASVPISPIPSTYHQALKDPNWFNAMSGEYNALMAQNTWSLVPKPAGANVVIRKWIFHHKHNPDGSLARYKARWVVHGFTRQHGIDYEETFIPVIKPTTIQVVLSIATSQEWPIHQLDVKNAFLHGNLAETIFTQQHVGFLSSVYPDYICKLHKSLYGLKQAPCTWFLCFTSFLSKLGFHASKSDSSLFVLRHGHSTAYLPVYVDDIVLTTNSSQMLHQIIASLQSEFAMNDLGPLQHFLGISVHKTSDGLILSQAQYAVELLSCANMSTCNPYLMPADTKSKPSIMDGKPLDHPSKYRSLAGALQYLTLARPDICFAVQ
jgi:hypothetical protein